MTPVYLSRQWPHLSKDALNNRLLPFCYVLGCMVLIIYLISLCQELPTTYEGVDLMFINHSIMQLFMRNSFSYFISHVEIFCLLSTKSAPTVQHFRSLIKNSECNVRTESCSFVYYSINCAITQTHRYTFNQFNFFVHFYFRYLIGAFTLFMMFSLSIIQFVSFP